MRDILHIDMDAFYAAVEERDFPQYRNKPLVVGGAPHQRGVVATCNYAARQFGIHSALACAQAKRLCPQAIFVRPRFDVYRQVSQQIRQVMYQYTDLVEPLSLDEAYLDVTPSEDQARKRPFASPTLIAKSIKQDILKQTQLTASAGISYNKFLAKIASDLDKPDGLTLITQKQGPEFVKQLAIGKFYGIGPATEAKMQDLGIYTGEDLLQWSIEELRPIFGKISHYYYHAARGQDDRRVQSHRQRKSIGAEKTYDQDLRDPIEMLRKLNILATEVWQEMQLKGVTAKTLTVKVKFHDFVQVTRAKTFPHDMHQLVDLTSSLQELLHKAEVRHRRVRLLGVTASNLSNASQTMQKQQLSLL